MSAEPKKSVSLSKPGADPDAPKPERPQFVLYAVVAMGLSALAALIASLTAFTSQMKVWLHDALRSSYHDTLKSALTDAAKQSGTAKTKAIHTARTNYHNDITNLAHNVSQAQKALLINGAFTVVLVGLIGYMVYQGRHWSRWGVIGLWAIATIIMGLPIGLTSFQIPGLSTPLIHEIPAVGASLLYLAAVVFVNLRPSVAYFAANRPALPAGRAAAGGRPRRGLFAPPAAAGDTPRTRAGAKAAPKREATTRPATVNSDRARSKRRTETAAATKGADLARTRAKAAAKSRRTES